MVWRKTIFEMHAVQRDVIFMNHWWQYKQRITDVVGFSKTLNKVCQYNWNENGVPFSSSLLFGVKYIVDSSRGSEGTSYFIFFPVGVCVSLQTTVIAVGFITTTQLFPNQHQHGPSSAIILDSVKCVKCMQISFGNFDYNSFIGENIASIFNCYGNFTIVGGSVTARGTTEPNMAKWFIQ